MKRLIAAGIISVMITLTAFLGISIIRNEGKNVEKQIKEIQKTAFTNTGGKAEEFFYYWESKREMLAVFINHQVIDEIGRTAAKMVSAERAKNSLDIFESANEILFIIRGIEEDEVFSLFTLL